MLYLSERDRGFILLILESISKILSFTENVTGPEEFYQDQKTFDAVLMNFVVIGETAGKLEANSLKILTEIPWRQVIAFRNIIAHDYMGVDPEAVWEIIKWDIPDLQSKLNNKL
ncbi:MAG: HepT-like ribonuclease domain-containing protein [Leptospiraceae bacterium]|nr:HepT-like ribonuclease domain-containing protein [Leptospiraceae bacterium]